MMFAVADLPANMQNKITIEGDCWNWTGAKNSRGYGSVSSGNGKSMLAHRRSYVSTVGKIPIGLTIDHLCRNIACVNPAHLEPVTLAENIRRRYADQTHCAKGHEFAGDNLRHSTKGDGHTRRVCMACHRTHAKAYRDRQKERSA
jgi:hypothetical protein